ncbi:MAG TPA: hypothetical protein VIG08_17465 [Gemmatimonadales bacterium]|jgi:hypothetical protein
MVRLAEPYEQDPAPRLFVHGAASPARGARGTPRAVERASERALVLARAQDIVCVSEEVEPAYLAYLAELGLGPAPDRVVAASRFGDHEPGRALWARLAGSTEALRAIGTLLRDAGPSRLHPFIASRGSFALAAALEVASETEVSVVGGDPEIVERADHKHHIRERAIRLAIPVADGEVVQLAVAGGRRRRDFDALRAAVERWLRPTGRVLVRGTQGAGNSASYVVGTGGTDPDGLIRALADHPETRTYLVEAMVAATLSPNVQLHVAPGDGPITCVGVTDQRWERPLVHGGNLYPSMARLAGEMVDWATRLASSLQREGYAGLLSLDFVEYADPATNAPRAILVEASPRVTTDTYPLALFARLNDAQRVAGRPESAAFVSGTIDTRPRRFADFHRAAHHLLYSPTTGTGAVPVHIGALSRGKCGVVVLGPSRDAVLRASGELQSWCRREGR